jgi:hypothetical protein
VQVTGAGHSTVGGIGTHMVLWALSWDSVARLRGRNLHDLDWESHGGAHHVTPEAASEVEKLRRRLSYICTDSYNADDLMKFHGSVRVVRMWCDIRTKHVLKCFDNPEGLSYGNLLVGVVPELMS